ncbi:hypothetical protein ACFSJF_10550 [Ornithinibacillus salinisoli]|uniref:Uncharacterized protein n=1 Tax=Ornithinibacillus salinisoli TaxID=1848459 RepID=A0ABW4VZF6_9BACI
MKDIMNPFQVREILEQLAEYLSVKQIVVVLFMEVFNFTAKETAGMLRDTEISVYKMGTSLWCVVEQNMNF